MHNPAKPPATLEAAVREKVRTEILSGALGPNERLRIRNLSERYGVGGSPLREALSRLVPEGLISFEENRGFKVAPLSIEELIEITEMRQFLEVEAFRRSMERGDDDWEGAVVAAFHRLAKILTKPLPDASAQRLEWERRHRDFHLALLGACGNGKLLHAAEQLYQHLARYRTALSTNELPAERLAHIHRQLMEAALDRDLVEGPRMLRAHFDINVEQVRQTLRNDPKLFEPSAGE